MLLTKQTLGRRQGVVWILAGETQLIWGDDNNIHDGYENYYY